METNKRQYCKACEYPLSTCVCDAIKLISTGPNITIIQDKRESTHAKNTAKLVKLGYLNSNIVINLNTKELRQLQQNVAKAPEQWAVLFPSEEALDLESSADVRNIKEWIVIDGTWKHANKIMKTHTWLNDIVHYKLVTDSTSQYRIRHSNKVGSLSTLEAVAELIEGGYGLNSTSLYRSLNKMQSYWDQYRPSSESD